MALRQLLLSIYEFYFTYESVSELTIRNSFHTTCLLLELLVVWNGYGSDAKICSAENFPILPPDFLNQD